MEFFSYACKFCHDLEPDINPWVGRLESDVSFAKVPAMFGGVWDVYGQLFLTLKMMGVAPSVHESVFDAVGNHKKLLTLEDMGEFLEGEGVDREKFLSTYVSFAVQSAVMTAKTQTRAAGVKGVPAMVVGGKYRFDLSAGGATGLLELADNLIEKERAARPAAVIK